MPTPFPGMDPYLEHPGLWQDVHNSLIADLRNVLAPQLLPKYYIALEERTYLDDSDTLSLIGRPDVMVVEPMPQSPVDFVSSLQTSQHPAPNGFARPEPVIVELPLSDEVRETYLEIRRGDSHEVVTIIELLSPANKHNGRGRKVYEEKRQEVLDTMTHFVEIDFLRTGRPMTIKRIKALQDYYILVSRAEMRPSAQLYPFNIRIPIPQFNLPLQSGDKEPIVDLNQILHDLYSRVRYDMRIDYGESPVPRLKDEDAVWANQLLTDAGLR